MLDLWQTQGMAQFSSPAHHKPTPWRSRAQQVGWALLPLRLFLGVTMVYAGLLKFFDPAYLDPASPNGVQSQMTAAAGMSPIGGLVGFTAEHAAVFGWMIAFGELIVGLGILLGLWTRIAALGGFLLSLSFFLTVSWGTTPYFFGPDIVFMFAFTPLMIAGDGGLLSLSTAFTVAARRRMSLAIPAPVGESPEVSAAVSRRALIRTSATVALVGAGAVAVGAIGRMSAGSSAGLTASGESSAPASSMPATVSPSASPDPTTSADTKSVARVKGKRIAKVADVPVGGVVTFNDPKTGAPAYLLRPAKGQFLAYSAVCTHQGCTVGFDKKADLFVCPCHGAEFNGANGDVVRGPATRPLAKIPVQVSQGVVYAV